MAKLNLKGDQIHANNVSANVKDVVNADLEYKNIEK
jgi:hypothetical protein